MSEILIEQIEIVEHEKENEHAEFSDIEHKEAEELKAKFIEQLSALENPH
jgi:Mor family transcriptional regulator